MKYIRTKEGVFGPFKDNDFVLEKGMFFGKPILKQADTAEELCDQLVSKYKDEDLPKIDDMHQMLSTFAKITLKKHIASLFDAYKDEIEYIVGAVWVGEGNLNAVLKFNEKGESELQ